MLAEGPELLTWSELRSDVLPVAQHLLEILGVGWQRPGGRLGGEVDSGPSRARGRHAQQGGNEKPPRPHALALLLGRAPRPLAANAEPQAAGTLSPRSIVATASITSPPRAVQ